MYRKIVVEIELDFEDIEFLPEDLEEKLHDSINDVIEDFAPDNKEIKITIED